MLETDGPTLGELGEFGLIDQIAPDVSGRPGVILGPGDDTAIVTTPSGSVLATTDVLIEGTHFRRDWSSPGEIGRKAAAASLADVAAMGGVATALLVGFGAPADLPAAWAIECSGGLRAEAQSVGAFVVGGDVVGAPLIVVSVTALGDLQGRQPVLRAGAAPGDVIALAGRLGWAASGLAVLNRGLRSPRALVDAHRVPEPPYAAGPIAARGGATSMIDVSDGLIADARHIAEASGVIMAISSALLPIADPIRSAAAAFNVDPLEWVLTGGEDHALLATFVAGTAVPAPFEVIGVVVAVGSRAPGVDVDGTPIDRHGGHEHFG